jgi:hypothetical protein
MTENYPAMINKLVNSNKIHRFQDELVNTTNIKRQDELRKIIEYLELYKTDDEKNEDELINHLKKLKNDKERYNKRWFSLSIEEKTNRIEKYFRDNNINNDSVLEELKEMVNDKIFKTSYIIYDKNEICIKEINILKENENKELYISIK